MRTRPACRIFVVGTIVVALAAPAFARDAQDPVLPARPLETGGIQLAMPDVVTWQERLDEVQKWVADFRKWQAWQEQWQNRREPGLVGPRERQVRPDPPAWLDSECREVVIEGDETFAEACRALAEWRDDFAVSRLRQQASTARAQQERVRKTVWWEHVHIDALWPMMQVNGSVFGVVGMHATIDVAGRFQIFAAPGAILLNLPNEQFSREWRPATDFGFAYRLVDFKLPGSERQATLHVNFAKAWVLGGPNGLAKTSIDLAGFSITLARKR